jgi:hypothetical protein
MFRDEDLAAPPHLTDLAAEASANTRFTSISARMRKRPGAVDLLVRDRAGIYGEPFRSRVEGISIEEIRIAPRTPWQNCYVERVIGSIRRECLNHVIVNDNHLRRLARTYP